MNARRHFLSGRPRGRSLPKSSSKRARQPRPVGVERLEDRQLLSGSPSVLGTTPDLAGQRIPPLDQLEIRMSPPEASLAIDDVTAVSLGNLPITSVGRLGGEYHDMAVAGDHLFAGTGAGLMVFDISNPTTPQFLAELPTAGGINDVEVNGSMVYLAAGKSGLLVVDATNAAAPFLTGQYDTAGTAEDVEVVYGKAYVADGSKGLVILDVSTPSQPKFLGTYDTSGTAVGIDVVGTTAYIADSTGVVAFNVATPASPQMVRSFHPTPTVRDIGVRGSDMYVATDDGLLVYDSYGMPRGSMKTIGAATGVEMVGSLAYVSGSEGLSIVDTSNPDFLVLRSQYTEVGSAGGVAVASNKAYLADADRGLAVLDVNIPGSPQRIGEYSSLGTVLDFQRQGAFGYLAAGKGGAYTVDLADPQHPQLSTAWTGLTDARKIELSGTFAVVVDEGNRLSAYNVGDPISPVPLGSITLNANIEGLTVVGPRAYVAAGADGLIVVDFSDPGNPLQAGQYQRFLTSFSDVRIAGSVAVLAAGSEGVLFTDIQDLSAPVEVAKIDTAGSAQGVDVSGDKVYVAAGTGGFEVIDWSDPAAPRLVGSLSAVPEATEVKATGTIAWIAGPDGHLTAIDVAQPDSPRLLRTWQTPGNSTAMEFSGALAYVADGPGGLGVLQIGQSPQAIEPLGEGQYRLRFAQSLSGDVQLQVGPWVGNGVVQGLDQDQDGRAGEDGDDLYFARFYAFQPPSGLTLSPDSIGENHPVGTTVGVLTAVDPDGGPFIYSLVPGEGDADNARFTIVNGQLQTAEILDYERRADYQIRVQVSDSDGMIYQKAFVVHVTDALPRVVATNPALDNTVFRQPIDGVDLVFNDGVTPESFTTDDVSLLSLDTPQVTTTGQSGGAVEKVQRVDNMLYAATGAGVAVYDVTWPLSPVRKGLYADADIKDLVVDQKLVYAASSVSGLLVLNFDDPTAPTLVARMPLFNASTVAISGTHVFVGTNSQDMGVFVYDISNPTTPVLAGKVKEAGGVYDVEATADRLYIAAAQVGVEIVDISNFANLQRLGTFYADARGLAVEGSRLYIAADASGVITLDVSNPATPIQTGQMEAIGAKGIRIADGKAYIAADSTGLVIASLASPDQPSKLGLLDTPGYAKDVVVFSGKAYVADHTDGLSIVDVSTPATPRLLGTANDLGFAGDVAVTGNIVYVATADEGVAVFDTSLPGVPVLLGMIDTDGLPQKMAVVGSRLYLADAIGGLDIFDITHPATPVLIGTYNTWASSVYRDAAVDVAVAGSRAAVALEEGGVLLLDISDPAAPVELGRLGTTGNVLGVAYDGGPRLYIADSQEGLVILDVTNPAVPTRMGNYAASATGVAVKGNLAYLNTQNGLVVLDITNPQAPALFGQYGQTKGTSLELMGNVGWLTSIGGSVELIDFSNPAAPRQIASLRTNGVAYGTFLSGNQLYVAAGFGGLVVAQAGAKPQAVTQTGDDTYHIAFGQSLGGSYMLWVGPAVENSTGGRMDQDGDGQPGEQGEDLYTARFRVNRPPTSSTATVAGREDQDLVFSVESFPFTDPDPGSGLAAVEFTRLPTAGTLYLDKNANGQCDSGEEVALGQSISRADLTGGQLRFRPAAEESGQPYTTFGFRVNDGDRASVAKYEGVINIAGVNDAPSFAGGLDQTVDEDAGLQVVPGWATAISAGPANEQWQTLRFVVAADNPALFTVQPTVSVDGTLSYQSFPNASGRSSVLVTLEDNGGTQNGGTDRVSVRFWINVTAVNDPPTISPIGTQRLAAGSTNIVVPFTVGDVETAANDLIVTAISSNPGVVPASGIVLGGHGTQRTLTLTPTPGAIGTTTITVTLMDGQGGLVRQRFLLAVGVVVDADLPGVYAPDSSTFFLRDQQSGGDADHVFTYGVGGLGWTELMGDWNGDGIDTPAMYDPQTSTFYIHGSNTAGDAELVFNFGVGGQGWQPLVGDWDGNGTDTVGLYEPATSIFFLSNRLGSGPADEAVQFGVGSLGWKPLVGDWDGLPGDGLGFYEPATSLFFLKNAHTSGPAETFFQFGMGSLGWVPLVGNWDGTPGDGVGFYVPETGQFFLKNAHAAGPAEIAFTYGVGGQGWRPLVGQWREDAAVSKVQGEADAVPASAPAATASAPRAAGSGDVAALALQESSLKSGLEDDWLDSLALDHVGRRGR